MYDTRDAYQSILKWMACHPETKFIDPAELSRDLENDAGEIAYALVMLAHNKVLRLRYKGWPSKTDETFESPDDVGDDATEIIPIFIRMSLF